jgi:hypothetical protein
MVARYEYELQVSAVNGSVHLTVEVGGELLDLELTPRRAANLGRVLRRMAELAREWQRDEAARN